MQNPRSLRALVAVNVAGAIGSSAFAAAGALRPEVALPGAPEPVGDRTRFWARASAVRTFAVSAPLVAGLVTGRPVPHLLAAAGLVQLGDAVLGVLQRDRAMATVPVLLGATHLVTARVLHARQASRSAPEPAHPAQVSRSSTRHGPSPVRIRSTMFLPEVD